MAEERFAERAAKQRDAAMLRSLLTWFNATARQDGKEAVAGRLVEVLRRAFAPAPESIMAVVGR